MHERAQKSIQLLLPLNNNWVYWAQYVPDLCTFHFLLNFFSLFIIRKSCQNNEDFSTGKHNFLKSLVIFSLKRITRLRPVTNMRKPLIWRAWKRNPKKFSSKHQHKPKIRPLEIFHKSFLLSYGCRRGTAALLCLLRCTWVPDWTGTALQVNKRQNSTVFSGKWLMVWYFFLSKVQKISLWVYYTYYAYYQPKHRKT